MIMGLVGVEKHPESRAVDPLNLTEEEFLTVVEHQAKPLIVPLCCEISLPKVSPMDLYQSLQSGKGFLLESMEGSEKIARYSYIGWKPNLVIRIGELAQIQGEEPFVSIARNPEGPTALDMVRNLLQRFTFVNIKAPRFFGGLVGYFSYDLVYNLNHPRLTTTRPPNQQPLAQFLLVKDCIVFDHVRGRLFIFCSPLLTYDSDPREEYRQNRERISELASMIRGMEGRVEESPAGTPSLPSISRRESMTEETFCDAVRTIKEHILAGDIFQAVLSRRIDLELPLDPRSVYRSLRTINPSPYMYYLDFGDLQVIGASPEMLVRVEQRKVTTVPIAGTRLRGSTLEEDTRLARELLSDEKEKAEHTMLVDLARNDLGRVCKFGSVRVEDFMSVERFSHVQHIVSTVHGTLRDDLDPCEAFRSCFPAGTVSGAPKLRAMQIIEELEPERRGLYAGAVGYLGFDRNLEFAITIRTIVTQGNRTSLQVGAGIVADSDPLRELAETENKARAMLSAIEAAGGVE